MRILNVHQMRILSAHVMCILSADRCASLRMLVTRVVTKYLFFWIEIISPERTLANRQNCVSNQGEKMYENGFLNLDSTFFLIIIYAFIFFLNIPIFILPH